MSRNNDVFQVLVTSGNQAVLAPGNKVEDLALGQIGVFSYETNLSIDGSVLTDARNFYLAVGVTGDVVKSSGTHIQKKNVTAFTTRCHTPSQPKIVDLYGFTASCGTDYLVKFELANEQIYKNYGYNQFTKIFSVKTSDCEGCEDCPSGDCIELAKLLVAAVNADDEGLITAEFVDYFTDPDNPVVVADADVWAAIPANVGQCLGVRFTTVAQAINDYCQINLKYYHPREIDIIASLPSSAGFKGNGTLVTFQDLVYPEGDGYDIAQLEYEAGGWNGKPGPYRVGELAGVPIGDFTTYTDKTAQYLQVNLTYDQESVGGWQEYKNNLNTLIAIPCPDAVTRDALVPILDTILAGSFGPLADDVAACAACGTVNTTSAGDDTDTDGIG